MTIEYASGPTVMMMLGKFQFGISTAAYQELNRSTEWRWPAQERFQQGQALQFVGPGADTISLPGVIYPEFRGGFGQLEAMRGMANAGEPMTLIDGNGNIMGRWVIERLEEKQGVFAAAGRPRKQEFTLALRKFDENTSGLGNAGSLVGGVAGGIPGAAGIPSELAGVADFIKSAASNVASLGTSIGNSLAGVQSVASELASMGSQIIAPISGALRTANNLQRSLNDAQRMLGMKPTNLSALTSLNRMVNSSASAVANCGQFSSTLSRAARDLQGLGTLPDSASRIVQGAVVSVNKLTVAATSLQANASKAITNLTT